MIIITAFVLLLEDWYYFQAAPVETLNLFGAVPISKPFEILKPRPVAIRLRLWATLYR